MGQVALRRSQPTAVRPPAEAPGSEQAKQSAEAPDEDRHCLVPAATVDPGVARTIGVVENADGLASPVGGWIRGDRVLERVLPALVLELDDWRVGVGAVARVVRRHFNHDAGSANGPRQELSGFLVELDPEEEKPHACKK